MFAFVDLEKVCIEHYRFKSEDSQSLETLNIKKWNLRIKLYHLIYKRMDKDEETHFQTYGESQNYPWVYMTPLNQ